MVATNVLEKIIMIDPFISLPIIVHLGIDLSLRDRDLSNKRQLIFSSFTIDMRPESYAMLGFRWGRHKPGP